MTLQSHEDTRAYTNVYNYVKEGLGQAPEKWMADAAKEITAAGEEVILLNHRWQPFFAFSFSPTHAETIHAAQHNSCT